jgi:ribosome-associated translation inhibitor RaiA
VTAKLGQEGIRGRAESRDLTYAIELVTDRIELQIRKSKGDESAEEGG